MRSQLFMCEVLVYNSYNQVFKQTHAFRIAMFIELVFEYLIQTITSYRNIIAIVLTVIFLKSVKLQVAQ